jgi:hypothetical protein
MTTTTPIDTIQPTGFQVTTEATAHLASGSVDAGTITWTVTPEDLHAGRYRLETPRDAASRIARHWHLDRLEGTYPDASIDVTTGSVTALEASS